MNKYRINDSRKNLISLESKLYENDRNTKLKFAKKLVNLELSSLPSDMQPAIRSDIGIATKKLIGCESSLGNVVTMQFLLEQVMKNIFF